MNKVAQLADSALAGAGAGVLTSIVTGAAVSTQPVTILWGLITVGTCTTIAWPVVAAGAALGAATACAARALAESRKAKKIDGRIEELLREAEQM